MKNIILLIVLLLPFYLKSQNNNQGQDDINSNLFHVEYRNQLSYRFKKVCKPGVYSRLEKYFIKDDHLKYVIDGYDIFKHKNSEDYKYIIYDVESELDYYKKMFFALENILKYHNRVDYEFHKKFTALIQLDNEDNVHLVFILDPNSLAYNK